MSSVQDVFNSTQARLKEINAGVASAEAETKQKEQELLEMRLDPLRPNIREGLAKTIFAVNTSNENFVGKWLLQNKKPATEDAIAEAIKALGPKLAQKPPLTEAELRQELINEGASPTLIAKFEYMTMDQLWAKLEELKNVNRWKSMSHNELVAEVKLVSQVPPGITPVAPGTPILEPHISRRALARGYSAEEMLKLIRSMDQKFGVGAGDVAVSARLSGADALEIKRLYSI